MEILDFAPPEIYVKIWKTIEKKIRLSPEPAKKTVGEIEEGASPVNIRGVLTLIF